MEVALPNLTAVAAGFPGKTQVDKALAKNETDHIEARYFDMQHHPAPGIGLVRAGTLPEAHQPWAVVGKLGTRCHQAR